LIEDGEKKKSRVLERRKGKRKRKSTGGDVCVYIGRGSSMDADGKERPTQPWPMRIRKIS